MIVVVIALLIVAGVEFWLLSKAGANLKFNTESQLYTRFNRHRDHRRLLDFLSPAWVKTSDEIKRMEEELKARGYDLDKLDREYIDATLVNRPMDLSQCRHNSATGLSMRAPR